MASGCASRCGRWRSRRTAPWSASGSCADAGFCGTEGRNGPWNCPSTRPLLCPEKHWPSGHRGAKLNEMAGRLYLCATPIGNLGDASPRLREGLASADVVYAEDTRRSGKLVSALGIEARLRSFFVGNERRRVSDLEDDLRQGLDVAVITDAGAPAVSDPGTAAVRAARQVGAEVVVVPGPSAVTAAVTGSGLVEGPFVFEAFLARKGRERAAQLAGIAAETRPSVVFLSPHRAVADLGDLAATCGEDREICVARELTKVHEEFRWGTLRQILDWWEEE